MDKLRNYLFDESLTKKRSTFFISFGMSIMVMLLFSAMTKGVYLFFGDYNYQQIPFYYHVHEAVRNGALGWDFATDLGSDLFETYTFYLLGSPFFWITIPFPNSMLPYMMPWLLSLKTGLAALFAYIYIRQFTKNELAASLGGILYAYSGFQLYNLLFNHFHDPVCLFPLLLLASDKLMMEKKKGPFAAIVALCAVTNYFFFAHMAVFTVIYFVVNIIAGRYKFTVKDFIGYAFEAVLGVLCAAVILVPSFHAVMTNNRGTDFMRGNPFIYGEWQKYFVILKSFFTFTDIPLLMYLDTSDELSSASVSAYLPFVSMCGVIGYIGMNNRKSKKHDMLRLMFHITFAIMLVPVLNSAFSMFNSQFYARWYFAPILIMCTMTAVCAAENVRMFRRGFIPCVIVPFVVLTFYVFYSITKESGSFSTASIAYPLCQSIIPIGCMMMMYSAFDDKTLDTNSKLLSGIFIRTCLTAICSLMLVIGYVRSQYPDISYYDNAYIKARDEVDTLSDGNMFRVDMEGNYTNVNLMWNVGSAKSFSSIVNPSINKVMEKIGFERGTASNILPNYYAYRCLLSVKYYFDSPYIDENGMIAEPYDHPTGLDIFEYKDTMSRMWVYENKYFIPMGFTYDKYMTDSDFETIDNRYFRMNALLDAVVLDDEQAVRFGDILGRYDTADCRYETERLEEAVNARRAGACEYFHTDNRGFEAKYTGDSDELVFFSIPYDEGWRASINGVSVPVERVSYGFCAVRTAPGENVIRFDYTNKYVKMGLMISLCGCAVLAAYWLLTSRRKRSAAAIARADKPGETDDET